MEKTLQINHEISDTTDTILLSGRIDTITSPSFEAAMKETLDFPRDIILDFEQVNYISSSGLRVLLMVHKKIVQQQKKMTIIHAGESIMEVFDITGFTDILNIE